MIATNASSDFAKKTTSFEVDFSWFPLVDELRNLDSIKLVG
jgi:hypothetical protein